MGHKKGVKITDPKTLERLAKARQKAIEVRRANAKVRAQKKLVDQLEKHKAQEEVKRKLKTLTLPVAKEDTTKVKPAEKTPEVKDSKVEDTSKVKPTAKIKKEPEVKESKLEAKPKVQVEYVKPLNEASDRQKAKSKKKKKKKRRRYVYVSESDTSSSEEDKPAKRSVRDPAPRQRQTQKHSTTRPSLARKSRKDIFRDQLYYNTYQRGLPRHFF